MTQRMKARRSFRYATRMLQAGDEFDATRQDARVLTAIGRAAMVEEAVKPKAEPKAVAEQEADADADDDGDEPVKRRRGRPAKPRD